MGKRRGRVVAWNSALSLAVCGLLPAGALGVWVSTFDDEFDGTAVDTTRWAYGLPWGNAFVPSMEQEAYNLNTSGNANVTVSGGLLHLTATANPNGPYQPAVNQNNHQPLNQPYTSGCLTTKTSTNPFSQQYGLFEVRARLPQGQGLWPAFWLLSTSDGPPEIDVFEGKGSEPTVTYMTLHPSSGSAQQGVYDGGASFDPAAFHTYSVAWSPSGIDWSIDGVVRFQTGAANVPNVPMRLLLNLAVGGPQSFVGSPDASTSFPATMDVDYVRVFSDVPEPCATAIAGAAFGRWLLGRRRARAGSAGALISRAPSGPAPR